MGIGYPLAGSATTWCGLCGWTHSSLTLAINRRGRKVKKGQSCGAVRLMLWGRADRQVFWRRVDKQWIDKAVYAILAEEFKSRQQEKRGVKESMMRSELEQIPGIGKNMAQHLKDAGFPTIKSLKGKDPEEIYLRDCAAQNCEVDRCALYAYRLAVHYADHNGALPPDKANWWDWKD